MHIRDPTTGPTGARVVEEAVRRYVHEARRVIVLELDARGEQRVARAEEGQSLQTRQRRFTKSMRELDKTASGPYFSILTLY